MFDENARGALIQHLGYVPQPEEASVEKPVAKEEAVVAKEETPAVNTITAEDLFAGASPSTPEPAEPAEPVCEEPETSEVLEDPATWSGEIKNCIVVGDFGRAVDICFKYGRYADAMMIAMWGGDELMEQTRVCCGVRG